ERDSYGVLCSGCLGPQRHLRPRESKLRPLVAGPASTASVSERASNEKSPWPSETGAPPDAPTEVTEPPMPALPPWIRLSSPQTKLFSNASALVGPDAAPNPVNTILRKSATPLPFRSLR